MIYTLEKKIESKWYRVGDFSKPLDMIKESFKLGKCVEVEDVRVSTYTDPTKWSIKNEVDKRISF